MSAAGERAEEATDYTNMAYDDLPEVEQMRRDINLLLECYYTASQDELHATMGEMYVKYVDIDDREIPA